jgi:putative membrane protein insertion efficiency factor
VREAPPEAMATVSAMPSGPRARRHFDVARLLIAVIHLYQRTFSRFMGPVCRFEPSCSRYAVASLEARGAIRGGLLSIVRLCKCHPFHPGGYDPPPTRALEQGGPEAR